MAKITIEEFRKLTKPKRHKYGVAPVEQRTIDGIVFASKRESEIYAGFQALRRAGVIERMDLQVAFPLVVNGALIARYVADFRIVYKDGRTEVVEVKGMATPVWRLKEKLFRALYPKVELRVIK